VSRRIGVETEPLEPEDLTEDGADEPEALFPPSRRTGAGAAVPLPWFGLLVLYDGLVLVTGLL